MVRVQWDEGPGLNGGEELDDWAEFDGWEECGRGPYPKVDI